MGGKKHHQPVFGHLLHPHNWWSWLWISPFECHWCHKAETPHQPSQFSPKKIEPERTKSNKITPPKKEAISLPTRTVWSENILFSTHGWGHFVTHVSSILAISRVATAETLQRLALAVLGSCFESESPGVSGRKPLGGNCKTFLGGGFNLFFMFTPNLGEDEPFLTSIFSNGLRHQRFIWRAR